MFQTGRTAMAMAAYERADQLEPNAFVLSNLGACYRRMNREHEARTVLDLALFRDPANVSALCNRGSVAVNNGNPHEGIGFLERARKLGTDHAAIWNLGILYLEAGRFADGFALYSQGIGHERLMRSYERPDGREPAILTPDHERAGKTLILWGEQGIGDELMYGTLLEQARADFGEVIFDCHPRLEWLHRQAHPGLRIYPTRKADGAPWVKAEGIAADYRAPIGELARLYRPSRESFTWSGPVYRADPDEAASYRGRLQAAAQGRPIVGLAMRGGVMSTARTERSVKFQTLLRLFQETDAYFVGLDYEDMTEVQQAIEAQVDPGRYAWFPSITEHWDYHHTAALVAATDLVVTVCQSVAHLSASLGHPTRVLVPARCAWRYGLTESRWYWYDGDHVQLLRQARGTDDWTPALGQAVAAIRELRP